MMYPHRHRLAVFLIPVWLLVGGITLVAQTALVASNAEHQRGIELYRKAHYEAAARHFRGLIEKNKADDLSWYYLGLTLRKQDKLKDSTKALESALKLNPNFALARSALSYIYLLRRKNSEALKQAERALTITPTLAEAHYVVGIVRLRSDLPQQALDSANEAIRFASGLAGAHLLRSLAVVGLHTKKATENYNPKIRRTSSGPITPEERERRRQQRDEAATSFKDAARSLEIYLRLQPPDPSTPLWREQLETLQYYGKQTNEEQEKMPISERLAFGYEVTTKARILVKPAPDYNDAARNARVSGTVIMRAVLAADRTVRHIIVLRELPHGLTEEAVKAARRVKFEPATINGTPVSLAVQLEYNFHISR
jgi:TonB family protein